MKWGLTPIDEHGERSIIPVKAADNWGELTADGVDVDVVIAETKALPGNDPIPQVPAGAAVVTTHNSVEIPYLAAGRFGEDKLFPGVIRGFFIHTGPAEVTFRPGPMSLNVPHIRWLHQWPGRGSYRGIAHGWGRWRTAPGYLCRYLAKSDVRG